MKNIVFLITTVLLTTAGFSQDVNELERRNGFKDIKLGMQIDSLKGAKFKKEFKEREEFDCRLYSVEDGAYQKIGEVNVDKIEVKTYKGLIYEITVIADKDPRLMKALESIYGRAEYDLKNETYFWKGNTLIMKFKSHSKNQLEMVYYSFQVSKLMKEDKEKKVEAIADDF